MLVIKRQGSHRAKRAAPIERSVQDINKLSLHSTELSMRPILVIIIHKSTVARTQLQPSHLPAIVVLGTRNSAPIHTPISLGDRQQGGQHTSHAFSSDQASRERKAPNLPRLGPLGGPPVRNRRANNHRKGVVHLRDDKPETDGVPVGDPDVVALGNDGMLEKYSEGGDESKSNGCVPRRRMDRQCRGCDSDSDRAPGSDGRHTKVGTIDFEVDKTRIGLGKEDEETDREPDADERPKYLGPKLGLGSSTEQVMRSPVMSTPCAAA